jgi:hypothetical protein
MFRQLRHLRWSLSMSQQLRQQDGSQSASQNPGLGGCDKAMVPKMVIYSGITYKNGHLVREFSHEKWC